MSLHIPSRCLASAVAAAACTLAMAASPAHADPMAYVVTLAQEFGTVNLSTGSFTPIGPGLPEGVTGLVPRQRRRSLCVPS